MHELSVATGILDRALSAAAEHDADRIDELTVELGRATHVNDDQLRFCLETSLEGTIAADATVTIEKVTPYAVCSCGWDGTPDALELVSSYAPNVLCPECDSRITLERGRECRLQSIEIPDEERNLEHGREQIDEQRESGSTDNTSTDGQSRSNTDH